MGEPLPSGAPMEKSSPPWKGKGCWGEAAAGASGQRCEPSQLQRGGGEDAEKWDGCWARAVRGG